MLSKLLIKLLFISFALKFIFKFEFNSFFKAFSSLNSTLILFCFSLSTFLPFVQSLDFVSKEQFVIKINNKKIVKLKYSKSSVYHQYVILVKDKKKLIELFKKKGIGFGFHYPFAIHQLKVFKKQFKNKKFKNAERIAKEGISIPIDPNLSKKNIQIIIRTLNTL